MPLPAACIFSAALLLSPLAAASNLANYIEQVPQKWPGKTWRDLHREYGNIFRHGNRNAASHLWTKFLLERSKQMSHATLVEMFKGYCAVSGSPVRPSSYNLYKLTLDRVDGTGKGVGFMHYCCWPCVCDTQDFIRIDTRNVTTLDGVRTYRFAVLGDPCEKEEELERPFVQPFGRGRTTLRQSAPEVRCQNRALIDAPLSDHGYVIISMIFDAPEQGPENDWSIELPQAQGNVEPGRMSQVQGMIYQDEREYGPMCEDRAQRGYNSGMGEIFRKVAAISPIKVTRAGRNNFCLADTCEGSA